jgi:hypothetical protein
MVHVPPIVVFGRSEKVSLFAAMRASVKDKEKKAKKDERSTGGRDDIHHDGPSEAGAYQNGDDTDSSEEEADEDPKKLQHRRKQDQSLREALSKRMRIRVRVTKARPKTRGTEETGWPERAVLSVQLWLRTCLGDDGTEDTWTVDESQRQHRLSQHRLSQHRLSQHDYEHQQQHQRPPPYRQPLVISAPMFSPNHAATSFIRTSSARDDAALKAIRRSSTYSNYSTHSGY